MQFVKLEDLLAREKIIIINGDKVYGPYYYKYTEENVFGDQHIHCDDDIDQVFSLYADPKNKYICVDKNDETEKIKDTKSPVYNGCGELSIGDIIYVFLPHVSYYQKTAVSEFVRLADGSLLVEWSDGNTRHWSKIEDCKEEEEW